MNALIGKRIYREATIADIPVLHTIRMAVKENVLRNPLYVTEKDYAPFITTKGKGWVCEEVKKILGFVILDIENKNIWALFVLPDQESKGVGKALMRILLKWHFLRSSSSLWLSTGPGTRAERFYELTGWKKVGTLENGEVKFEIASVEYFGA